MTAPPEWWETFFTGLWLEVQPVFRQEGPEEVDAIERLLKLDRGSAILDVPCGEGRVSIELGRRGYKVTGVDFSDHFISLAEGKAKAAGVDGEWRLEDMRDLSFEGRFDAAINWWGSFGYFTDADNERFAASVFRALKPGGRFLIDAHCAETLLPNFRPQMINRVGDVTVLQEGRWDHATGRIHSEWTFIKGDQQERKSISMRIYTYKELTDLLRRAGFEDPEAWDWRTGQPFSFGAGRLALVANKPTLIL